MLLVRCVEEHDPKFFPPDVLSAATLTAAGARDDMGFIERRSAYLFRRLPRAVKAWAHIGLVPESSLTAVVVGTFLIGAFSNFIGPGGLIHIVYNPLAFLVLWNIAAYAVFAAREARSRKNFSASDEQSASPAGPLRLLIRDLWSAWNRWANRLPEEQLRNASAIADSFRRRYWIAAGPIVLARIEWLIHLGAIFLLLGAIAGTYVRGLFLEYNAIWRSTFVTAPDAVAGFLNVLYAPGVLLFDGSFLSTTDVEPLLSSTGSPAAAWIHRVAIAAAIVVIVPRMGLTWISARRAVRRAAGLKFDLAADGYYVAQLRSAGDKDFHHLREGISSAIRSGVAKLAESLAFFVRERFFDQRVAPLLLQFRNKGGRMKDIEEEIEAAQEAFQPQLAAYLSQAKVEFEATLRTGLQSLVGKELAQSSRFPQDLSGSSVAMEKTLPGSVARNLGDGIGATVILGVSTIVATLSGGIGKSLGIAIVSTLLGTSGPVGLLIGGLGAVIVGGAGYLMGRDKVTGAVSGLHLPATVVAFVLPESKIEKARQGSYERVKAEVTSHLEPQVTLAAEAILEKLVSEATVAPTGGSRGQ